jgi:hypothetical protein
VLAAYKESEIAKFPHCQEYCWQDGGASQKDRKWFDPLLFILAINFSKFCDFYSSTRLFSVDCLISPNLVHEATQGRARRPPSVG